MRRSQLVTHTRMSQVYTTVTQTSEEQDNRRRDEDQTTAVCDGCDANVKEYCTRGTPRGKALTMGGKLFKKED